jgi:hypothetical protein
LLLRQECAVEIKKQCHLKCILFQTIHPLLQLLGYCTTDPLVCQEKKLDREIFFHISLEKAIE